MRSSSARRCRDSTSKCSVPAATICRPPFLRERARRGSAYPEVIHARKALVGVGEDGGAGRPRPSQAMEVPKGGHMKRLSIVAALVAIVVAVPLSIGSGPKEGPLTPLS